jgi:hypothetical protein
VPESSLSCADSPLRDTPTAVRGTDGLNGFMNSNAAPVTGRDLVKGGGAAGLPFATIHSKDPGYGGYGTMGDVMVSEASIIFSGARTLAAPRLASPRLASPRPAPPRRAAPRRASRLSRRL